MFNRYGLRIRSRRFLLEWLGASVAVWPIAAVSTIPLTVGVAFVMLFICIFPWLPIYESGSRSPVLGIPVFFGLLAFFLTEIVVVGGYLGVVIGFVQRWLLRRHFAYRLQNFLPGSVLGSMAGIAVAFPFAAVLLGGMWPFEQLYVLLLLLFITPLALGQAWSLRPYVHGVWLWVLANLVGGLAFSSALLGEAFGVHVLLNLAAGIALQGAITGVAALWLFGRMARSDAPDDEMELKTSAPKKSD